MIIGGLQTKNVVLRRPQTNGYYKTWMYLYLMALVMIMAMTCLFEMIGLPRASKQIIPLSKQCKLLETN